MEKKTPLKNKRGRLGHVNTMFLSRFCWNFEYKKLANSNHDPNANPNPSPNPHQIMINIVRAQTSLPPEVSRLSRRPRGEAFHGGAGAAGRWGGRWRWGGNVWFCSLASREYHPFLPVRNHSPRSRDRTARPADGWLISGTSPGVFFLDGGTTQHRRGAKKISTTKHRSSDTLLTCGKPKLAPLTEGSKF